MVSKVVGGLKRHQYQVVGRHLPTESVPEPTLFRMKLWATNEISAKSKFWYFLRKLRKVKKANGQIIAINEHINVPHRFWHRRLPQIFEKNPTTVKNFGIWVRYMSRTGFHNAYKEYRDVTLNGAVEQMYQEMASRHRVRASSLSIIKTATVPAKLCKRDNVKQFHDSKISFPLTHKLARASDRKYKTVFKAVRPNVAMY